MSNKMALDALTAAIEAMESCEEGDYSTGHVCHPSFDSDAIDAAIEQARAAIAALQAEPQGWMPIETAPKDGTRILVCNKANYVYPARWQGVESGKPADWPHGWRDDVMFVAADGIVSWMQLPATPPKD